MSLDLLFDITSQYLKTVSWYVVDITIFSSSEVGTQNKTVDLKDTIMNYEYRSF